MFGGVGAEKSSQMGHIMNDESVINAILIKFTTIICLHKIFHMVQKLERKLKGVSGRTWKPLRMFFGSTSNNFSDCIKNRNIWCIILYHIPAKNVAEIGPHLEINSWKITRNSQNRSKIIVSSFTLTFSGNENYKCYLQETHLGYVNSWGFSSGGKFLM